ncbi:MAG: hypothetical protein ACI87E_005115 [Mariniblastus sp.]|jgi:hypothetical protein
MKYILSKLIANPKAWNDGLIRIDSGVSRKPNISDAFGKVLRELTF